MFGFRINMHPVALLMLVASMASVRLALDENNDINNINYINDMNCTNEYCMPDEDLIKITQDIIPPPKLIDWVMIAAHAIVLVMGLVDNGLICIAFYRNPNLRTTFNLFFLNLAVSDILVLLLCLPPTVLWDVTETWFFGPVPCKILVYLQTVSVSVSIWTLTCTSVDRQIVICNEKITRSFTYTRTRAKKTIFAIWVISLISDIPELVALHTVPFSVKLDNVIYTQCTYDWDKGSVITFTVYKLILLYLMPLSLMGYSYCDIIFVVWKRSIPGNNMGPMRNFRSQRNTVLKTLVPLVIMFTICFFPVHLLTILRFTMDIPANEVTRFYGSFSHWLIYLNSSLNPIVYCFSTNFRREFLRSFGCTSTGVQRHVEQAREARGQLLELQPMELQSLPLTSADKSTECSISV